MLQETEVPRVDNEVSVTSHMLSPLVTPTAMSKVCELSVTSMSPRKGDRGVSLSHLTPTRILPKDSRCYVFTTCNTNEKCMA